MSPSIFTARSGATSCFISSEPAWPLSALARGLGIVTTKSTRSRGTRQRQKNREHETLSDRWSPEISHGTGSNVAEHGVERGGTKPRDNAAEKQRPKRRKSPVPFRHAKAPGFWRTRAPTWCLETRARASSGGSGDLRSRGGQGLETRGPNFVLETRPSGGSAAPALPRLSPRRGQTNQPRATPWGDRGQTHGVPALKGREQPVRPQTGGSSSGSDGGATRCAFRPGSSSCSVCAALSGLEAGWRFFPRALPWAGLFGPFGARTWYLRANLSAANETSPAGCFRFGAREDRMNQNVCVMRLNRFHGSAFTDLPGKSQANSGCAEQGLLAVEPPLTPGVELEEERQLERAPGHLGVVGVLGDRFRVRCSVGRYE